MDCGFSMNGKVLSCWLGDAGVSKFFHNLIENWFTGFRRVQGKSRAPPRTPKNQPIHVKFRNLMSVQGNITSR